MSWFAPIVGFAATGPKMERAAQTHPQSRHQTGSVPMNGSNVVRRVRRCFLIGPEWHTGALCRRLQIVAAAVAQPSAPRQLSRGRGLGFWSTGAERALEDLPIAIRKVKSNHLIDSGD